MNSTKRLPLLKVTVRQFLTTADKNPVPMRVMFGHIVSETARAYKMKLKVKGQPSDVCMRCGRKITNPESIKYGLGSDCITKVPGAYKMREGEDFDEYMKKLMELAEEITWEGWLPKSAIKVEPTDEEVEVVEKPKPASPVADRKYPELCEEHEVLIEKTFKKFSEGRTSLKIQAVWVDSRMNAKFVFKNIKTGGTEVIKLEAHSSNASKSEMPYSPKYSEVATFKENETGGSEVERKRKKFSTKKVESIANKIFSMYN